MRKACVLSVAGSDSSGGAGIQADIKTLTMLDCFAMTAITALTAQNSTGVRASKIVSAEFLTDQIESVFEDMPVDAVKVGMIPNAELMEALAEQLLRHPEVPVVLDPVMVATSGSILMEEEALVCLQDRLIPRARVITPNLAEGALLSGRSIGSKAEMEAAAHTLAEQYPGTAILLKGGHLQDEASDLLVDGGRARWFTAPRIRTQNNHGSGCTLSSAIAAFLAKGQSLEEAVRQAKDYVRSALASEADYGCAGAGPLDHMWLLESNERTS